MAQSNVVLKNGRPVSTCGSTQDRGKNTVSLDERCIANEPVVATIIIMIGVSDVVNCKTDFRAT